MLQFCFLTSALSVAFVELYVRQPQQQVDVTECLLKFHEEIVVVDVEQNKGYTRVKYIWEYLVVSWDIKRIFLVYISKSASYY